jgi:hypothetical protein
MAKKCALKTIRNKIMKILCRIFGHKLYKIVELTENPYLGDHTQNGKKPYMLFSKHSMCSRCFFDHIHNTYIFSYGDLE